MPRRQTDNVNLRVIFLFAHDLRIRYHTLTEKIPEVEAMVADFLVGFNIIHIWLKFFKVV